MTRQTITIIMLILVNITAFFVLSRTIKKIFLIQKANSLKELREYEKDKMKEEDIEDEYT